MIGAGIIGVIGLLIVLLFMRDTPQSLGYQLSEPKKEVDEGKAEENITMAVASSQKCSPGTSKNKHNALTFNKPNINAGQLRLPLKILSEIRPEATVPIIPHTELMDIMNDASSVS